MQAVVLGRDEAAVAPEDRIHYDRKRLDRLGRVLNAEQVVEDDLVRLGREDVVGGHQRQVVEAFVGKSIRRENKKNV